MRDELEKELLSIKEKVRRSKLDYWSKMICYECLAKLSRFLNMEE